MRSELATKEAAAALACWSLPVSGLGFAAGPGRPPTRSPTNSLTPSAAPVPTSTAGAACTASAAASPPPLVEDWVADGAGALDLVTRVFCRLIFRHCDLFPFWKNS